MHGSKGWAGGPDPPPLSKNHKHLGFLSNIGPDPLKNHKATKPAFNGMPAKRHLMVFRWRADNGPLIVAFGSPHQLNKNIVKVRPPLTKLSGSVHVNIDHIIETFCEWSINFYSVNAHS